LWQGEKRGGGGDTFLMRFLKRLYAPVLRLAIRFPVPLVAASVAVFGLGLLLASGFKIPADAGSRSPNWPTSSSRMARPRSAATRSAAGF
jgi:hypothetical protein